MDIKKRGLVYCDVHKTTRDPSEPCWGCERDKTKKRDDAGKRQRIPVCPPVPRERDVISQVFADMRAAVVEAVCPIDGWSVAQHCRRAS